jgi:tRNA/rRNA methyltransferase
VTIPTAPAYASLNLAHAVVVMLYELALARGDEARPFKVPRRRTVPATAADLERMFEDLEAGLDALAFFKTRQRQGIMRTLREVLHRAPLDQREAKLLRAIGIEVVKYRERLAHSRLHVDRE